MKISAQNILAIFVFFVLGISFVSGQTGAAYSDGKVAGLSAAQIKKLSALKAAVAVPTHVPAGFKLKEVKIPKPDAAGVIDYFLVYENAKGKTFTIQSTNDGIGDMIVKEELTGKNPYFDGEFYAGRDEEGDETVAAQWIGSLKKYQPKTQKITQYYSLTSGAKSVTPQQAVTIMKSLRYLKR